MAPLGRGPKHLQREGGHVLARACPAKITAQNLPRTAHHTAGTGLKWPTSGWRQTFHARPGQSWPTGPAVMLQPVAGITTSHPAHRSLWGLPQVPRLGPNLNRSPGQNTGPRRRGSVSEGRSPALCNGPKATEGPRSLLQGRMTVATSTETPDTRGWRQAIARKLCDSRQTPRLWSSYTCV